MSALVDKEKRIKLLEEALTEACDWVESGAETIELLDGDDDDECKQARRKAAEWRRLLNS